MGETITAAKPTTTAGAVRDEWVARVLGLDLQSRKGANHRDGNAALANGQTQERQGGVDGLQSRLLAGKGRLAALNDPKIASALARLVQQIEAAIAAGDAGAGLPLLSRMEEVLGAAERKAAASGPVERNLVRYRVLQQEWRIAEGKATAALSAFGKKLLAHPDIANSNDLAAVTQQVDLLPQLVPAFSDKLGAALEAIEDAATDNDRASAIQAAHAAIQSYQSGLQTDSRLTALELFAGANFGGLDVLDELQTALQELDAALDG